MRYCQEKGIVCQYAGTNMHCRLTACVFPKESLYPTASGGGHLMNIEKLIEQLKYYGTKYAIGDNLGREIDGSDELMLDAATALSTLQAENERLRKELEYEREHANAYHEECGQWEAENTQLKEKLEAIKQDRDAIEQDFRAFAKQWWEEDSGFPCRWCKFERQGGCEWKVKHPGEICEGRAFEWRGPQKED